MVLRVFILGVFILQNCFAQDVERARGVVETLSSPYYHGRGYVNGGDSLAAEFVAKEFKFSGLRTFQDSYFQHFTFPVNTFPGKMKVKLDRKTLKPGRDYILSPSSYLYGISKKGINRIKGTYDLADSSWHRKGKAQNIQKGNVNVAPSKAMRFNIITKEKLTFGASTKRNLYVDLILKSGVRNSSSKKIHVEIDTKFIEIHHARNVIGFLEGTSKKDSFLVITAHYDHLGQLGKNTYFPGANDNASGIAMMLELAKYYADSTHRLPYSMMFIGFAGEEAGLIGSQYYVNNPLFPLSKIKFLVNLDLLGSGKDGITVVNGAVLPEQFSLLDSLNKNSKGLSKIVARGKAANSDHYPFSEKGVPAFFIYTLGEITAYHDIDDKAEVVTFSKFKEVFALLTDFLKVF